MRGNTVRSSWLRLRDGNSGAHRAIKDEEEKRIVWIGGCSRMARGGTTVKPCVVPSSNSRRDIAGNSQSRIVTLPCHSSGNRGCFANDIERPVSLNTLAAKRMGGARTKMTTQSGQHCLVLVCVLVCVCICVYVCMCVIARIRHAVVIMIIIIDNQKIQSQT